MDVGGREKNNTDLYEAHSTETLEDKLRTKNIANTQDN